MQSFPESIWGWNSQDLKLSKFRKFHDFGPNSVLCLLHGPRSGFSPNIGDFLELQRENKSENQKSGSNIFLGIPKAVQNRCNHSLKVSENETPRLWNFEIFGNFRFWTKFRSLPSSCASGLDLVRYFEFRKLQRENKNENRKSGSNKFLGIPKAA